ncbi:response regulator transcription factor [Dyella subtropica]|uniref:response regulator transcription factor n=1 Tax=Dyella subtropica TaxID=2992127 RepID=UPI00225422EA|nr:response regulator transcription factor [Dyella subtropica]
MRVLIVEDDHATAALIAAGLRPDMTQVDSVSDGDEGFTRATGGHYDLLIVDRMLPHTDGITMVRKLRFAGCEMPVLMVSALGEVDARVEGLEAGADDYLAKPFAMTELRARLSALSRRPRMAETITRLRVADLELDRISREVQRGGQLIELQPREFRLLDYLMTHVDRVVTRAMLLEHVWEFHFDPQTSVVETHISRLRAKIDRGFDNDLLHTIRGFGYCLRAIV